MLPDLGVKRLLESIRGLESGAVDAFHTMLQFASSDLAEKSVRVCVLALEMGERLGLSSADIKDLEFSALLHDIGFLGVPERILGKRGLLTVDERAQLMQHPQLGEAVLGGIPGFERVGRIVGGHHERPDGRGYPDSLRGADIPLSARILSVAETFQAMLTHRSYRSRLPLSEAISRLRAGAGSRYDGAIVDLLRREADWFERLVTDTRHRQGAAGLYTSAPAPEAES